MRVAGRLWRAFDALEAAEREHVRSEFVGVAYGAPLAAAGLVWLALATDPAVIAAKWPELLLTLALALALNQLDFFWVIERPGGSYERWSAPLGGLVTISAALLFGPTAIWIGVAVALVAAWRDWRGAPVPERRWGAARSLALGLSCSSIGGLLGLTLYERLGGAFPLPGFTLPDAPLAVLAVLTLLGFDWLCWSCYLLLVRWTQVSRVGALELGIFALF